MPEENNTQNKPPEIWEFRSIGSQQMLLIAERISINMNLAENQDGAELLIRLLAGITAECAESPECHVHYVTERAFAVFFAATQKSNDSFFDYVVNDLKIARDYREDERRQPEREMYFDSTLARIAYIIGKTRFLLSDQCEIADDEAIGKIRDLILEMDYSKEVGGQ